MDFLYFLQNLRNTPLNMLAQFVTYFGQELVLVGIICITYWCINKTIAYKACCSYFVSGLVVQTLKVTFRIERPFLIDKRLHPVDSAVSAATGYSFPSGHTQGATSIYSSLAFSLKKRCLSIIFAIIIVLVGFSRMYLGVHSPKDVLVSLTISLLLSIVVDKFFDYFFENDKRKLLFLICMEIINILLIIYCYYLVRYNKTTEVLSKDCFVTLGGVMGYFLGLYIEDKYIKYDTACKSIALQVLKVILGLLGLLVIKTCLPIIIGKSIIANIVRYFLIALWLSGIYPIIIKKVFN